MMKFSIIPILLLSLSGYGQTKIASEDLKIVVGNWEGSITYLDYQTDKPFTMPADLIVKQGNNENTIVLNNLYPKEPKANNSEKIKITKNGLLLNKNAVILREKLGNGQIKIQTEHEGKDASKKALIRYSYTIGSDVFVILKEVKFKETGHWIKRSEYNYRRKKK